MDKKLLAILKSNRKQQYENPDSIMRKYDAFLEKNKIYHSLNKGLFDKSINGRVDLCDGMLKLYSKAKLENERIMLLNDLFVIDYNKDKLVELILEAFFFTRSTIKFVGICRVALFYKQHQLYASIYNYYSG